ncbi:MAG TPA: Wzz/FepE/Etk N-terminal domain-containing protein, partial [Vicinamibacterales bacterium]|nr:Wzz/FepE/Etk N-terminal domain-containing protein [Vicinamibacterales bacterium]
MHRILGDRRSAPPDVRSDPRQVAGVPETTPPALDTHLSEYLRLLVKRRWTAVIGLALVLALVGLHVYTAVPIYEARVRLLIEQENQTAFSLRDNVAQDRATTDYYHTQYTILQSRSVAKGAIDAIGAWDNPELAGRMGPADLRATGVL